MRPVRWSSTRWRNSTDARGVAGSRGVCHSHDRGDTDDRDPVARPDLSRRPAGPLGRENSGRGGGDLPRAELDLGRVGRPGPPARGRARRPRRGTRRRGLVPGQEPSGLRRADHGRLDARRGQRDRQLPAGRRRGRLRGQRRRRQGAAGRHRADAAGRPDPRPADHRRARDRGDARRRGRRRLRGVAGRCAAPAAECGRRPGGRLPGHVLLGDDGSSEGRHAQPPQHGAAHDQRARRMVVRAGRQEPGGHAVVPRRWLVVRAVRHPRRHPQRDDP